MKYVLFRYLPREVDPLVYNMSTEDPGDVTYAQIGGLGEQIRELREVRQFANRKLYNIILTGACILKVDWPKVSPAA